MDNLQFMSSKGPDYLHYLWQSLCAHTAQEESRRHTDQWLEGKALFHKFRPSRSAISVLATNQNAQNIQSYSLSESWILQPEIQNINQYKFRLSILRNSNQVISLFKYEIERNFYKLDKKKHVPINRAKTKR